MNIRIKSATGLQVLGKIIHLGSFHSQLRKGGRQVSRALDGHLRHHPSNIFAKIPNRNLTKTLEYRLIGHNEMGTILNGTMGMKSEKSKTIICSSTKKFSGKKKGGGRERIDIDYETRNVMTKWNEFPSKCVCVRF